MKKILLFAILCLAGTALFAQLNLINLGTAPNAGNGDNLRVAFGKVNTNDTWLNARIDSLGSPTSTISIVITDQPATTADTSVYITISTGHPWAGKNLVQLTASWGKSYGTATVSVDAWRLRSGTAVKMTSTSATFTGQSTSTLATINPSNDDIQSGDKVYFISSKGAGTAPYEVNCDPIFQTP